MARKLRIALIAVVAVTSVVAVALGSVYTALGRVRPFYRQAIALDREKLERGSREMESRATVLFSEARQPGEWQAAFSAEQINGWLALQLQDVYADALPEEIAEPRVAIEEGRLTLGFRARRGGVDTVISADAAVMLTDEGEIAVQLLSVHAGALPLPVMQVAEDIAKSCQEMSLPVRWTRDGGQPVAIVSLTQSSDSNAEQIALDAVELRDGTIYLSGHTLRGER